MTINLTREGTLEEIKNGNAVIRIEDLTECKDIHCIAGTSGFLLEGFYYNGKYGLGTYKNISIEPFYNISFKEFVSLPSYREPIIELSKEIVKTKEKFIECLWNGEAELEVFGLDDKTELMVNFLDISMSAQGPYLYLDEETQELVLHKEPSNKPIVLDMKRFLEL